VTTLATLHAAARVRGIPHYRRATKTELVELLGGAAIAPVVRLERDGPLALVVLDDPATRNALGAAALDQLDAIIDQLVNDQTIRLVAVTGAGRVFSSGAAIHEYDTKPDGGAALTDRGSGVLDRLAALDVPVVALVNGHAVGGGVELALACDWRIIAPDAELRFVHASIGLVPGLGGLRRLARLVGAGVALRIVATCATLRGADAVRAGVADDVCTAAAQRQQAATLARTIEHSDRSAVAHAKRAIVIDSRDGERIAFLACWPNRQIPASARGSRRASPPTPGLAGTLPSWP
jgi:enoyl-CoA hydratase/carnithine racemase